MDANKLAQAFAAVDGNSEEGVLPLLEQLYDCLDNARGLQLVELELALARIDDAAAWRSYNNCVDLLCCESLSAPDARAPQWRSYALATAMRAPHTSKLRHLSNAEELAQHLAALADIPPEHLKVHPVHVPSADAFYMNAAQVFQLCGRVKAHADLVDRAALTAARTVRAARLQELTSQLGLGPENRHSNSSPATDRDATKDAITLVLHRRNPAQYQEFMRLQAVLSSLAEPLQATYELEGGRTVTGFHSPVAFGLPKSVFGSSMHLALATNLSVCLRQTATELGLDLTSLKLHIARVDDGSGAFSVRAGVSHPQRGLIAGVVEFDVLEMHQYVRSVQRLLSMQGLHAITCDESGYLAKVVDKAGHYAVPVYPGVWGFAPQTFVSLREV
ncbi:hypothetical protein D3C71_20970 [compost metagenome]